MARERFASRWLFGDQQAMRCNLLLKFLIFGWVGNVDPAGDHARRAAAKRTLMRRAVNPACQPRDDENPLLRQPARQISCEATRRRRGIARADDGNRGALK